MKNKIEIIIQKRDKVGSVHSEYRAMLSDPNTITDLKIATATNREDLVTGIKEVIADLQELALKL